MDDIQNLIYALLFEIGPKPKGSIQNMAWMFVALIEQAFLDPLPWQKIKVQIGPRNQGMYEVLKAAMRAIKELNPKILNDAKDEHKGQYALVRTKLYGEVSFGVDGYASFAKFFGTVTDQPGDLVNEILKRVDELFKHCDELSKDLDNLYGVESKQVNCNF